MSNSYGFSEAKDLLNIGYGLKPGYRRISAHGNNPDVDTAAAEDIWSGGGDYPFMTAATSLEIVSSSVNDTSAGTGARTVRIDGLDVNYAEVSQTVTMNGTTAVAIPSQLLRIQRAQVLTVGSVMMNEGDITIRDAGAGATRCHIPLGRSISQQSIFTVPAGYSLQITKHYLSINRSAAARWATISGSFRLWTSAPAVYQARILALDISISDTTSYTLAADPGLLLPEKTDYWHRCIIVSGNNTDVTGGWVGILKLNTVS